MDESRFSIKSIWTWLGTFFPNRDSLSAAQISRMAKVDRPGLNAIDMINFGFVQPVLRNAYTLAENCSLLSDIAQTLTQETFRAGMDILPRFAVKCEQCGYEMKEKKTRCDSCGSIAVRQARPAELLMLKRADGYSWIDKCNENGQTLLELCTQSDLHINTSDNAYIVAIKDYLFYKIGDENIPPGKMPGDVSDSFVREFICLDPRFVEKVFDKGGKPGGHNRICLKHRDTLLDIKQERCPQCGLRTHDVVARYYAATDSMAYFIEDEIIHLTKFYPHPLYGTPPAFKLRMNVFAYLYIEARIKNYYEKGRPPGIIAITTDNPQAVDENIRKINDQMVKDPNVLPWMPVSTGQSKVGKAVEYVQFMQDPSDQMMQVKNEIRRAICSFFNVSPLFMSDVSGASGFNNQGHQITILNRAIEKGQEVWNDKALMWMMRQLRIVDWKFWLNRSEQANEKDDAELQILKDQHAMNLQSMGFDIWVYEGQYKHNERPEHPPGMDAYAGRNLPIPEKNMSKRSGQAKKEYDAKKDAMSNDVRG